jgi:tetratricopeptide (TPR) repeat protein
MAQAGKDQPNSAIALLAGIATTNNDYQVRAFTHYEAAQIYYSRGDLWRWRAEAASIYDDSSKSGNAVQTWWRYRLAVQLGDYYLDVNPDLRHDLILANFTVEYDVTENPEPRFYRALINARYGNFREAKSDSEFILKVEPQNPSYRALAAYIAVLEGDKTLLQSFHGESIAEVRALAVLGESAYIGGDMRAAQLWWASAAKEYPLGAILAYYAGKKHLALGHQQVAASLLAECVTMAPDTKEAKDAKELLANLQSPDP